MCHHDFLHAVLRLSDSTALTLPSSAFRFTAMARQIQQDAEKLAQLQAIMKDCDQSVFTYTTQTLECKSLRDFIGLVVKESYETELKTVILDHTAVKDSKVQLSRLRAAWELGSEILAKDKKSRTAFANDDWDDPIESDTQQSLLAAWALTYNIVIPMFLMPSDTLLGRLYREIQRVAATVIPLKKVRSLFQQTMPSRSERIPVSSQVHLEVNREAENEINSILEYYVCLRILAYAYSLVGQHKVPSSRDPSKAIVFAPLSVNLTYADECLKRAITGHTSSVAWLQQKDEWTRAKMVEYMRQGVPQGEALEDAIKVSEVQWTLGVAEEVPVALLAMGQDAYQSSPRKQSSASSPRDNKRKRESDREVRTCNEFNGQKICKKRNDNRGCAARQKDCPDGKLHICDAVKPDGKPCGNSSHTRMNCPFMQ